MEVADHTAAVVAVARSSRVGVHTRGVGAGHSHGAGAGHSLGAGAGHSPGGADKRVHTAAGSTLRAQRNI